MRWFAWGKEGKKGRKERREEIATWVCGWVWDPCNGPIRPGMAQCWGARSIARFLGARVCLPALIEFGIQVFSIEFLYGLFKLDSGTMKIFKAWAI